MGNSLQDLSLMAVPMMILVAIGYRNWRDGRWPTNKSPQRSREVTAPAAGRVRAPGLRELIKHTH